MNLLRARYVLLAVLSGIFMIVSLPLGILFLIFTFLYYCASEYQRIQTAKTSEEYEYTSDPPDADEAVAAGQDDVPGEYVPYSDIDYAKLFNNRRYIQEQENNK